MRMVNMLEAKSSLSRLVDEVETGVEQEIIIARNGRPAARLAPLAPIREGRRIGVAEGHFVVPDTIDADCDEIVRLFAARME
jgi:prevent-host-death family protein